MTEMNANKEGMFVRPRISFTKLLKVFGLNLALGMYTQPLVFEFHFDLC
jgi:hypothetical protein